MTWYKFFMKTSDNKIVTVTLSPEQMDNLSANAAFLGITRESADFGSLLIEFARLGHVKSVNLSSKTREQIVEELRRNYGDNIVDLNAKKEDSDGQ